MAIGSITRSTTQLRPATGLHGDKTPRTPVTMTSACTLARRCWGARVCCSAMPLPSCGAALLQEKEMQASCVLWWPIVAGDTPGSGGVANRCR